MPPPSAFWLRPRCWPCFRPRFLPGPEEGPCLCCPGCCGDAPCATAPRRPRRRLRPFPPGWPEGGLGPWFIFLSSLPRRLRDPTFVNRSSATRNLLIWPVAVGIRSSYVRLAPGKVGARKCLHGKCGFLEDAPIVPSFAAGAQVQKINRYLRCTSVIKSSCLICICFTGGRPSRGFAGRLLRAYRLAPVSGHRSPIGPRAPTQAADRQPHVRRLPC